MGVSAIAGSSAERSLDGGDTASTGVRTRGMHAEPHWLANPVEYPLTADTQYALAA